MNKLELISKGRTGKTLLEVLEGVKQKVADIRTPITVRPEIQNEVRLGIIEALDSFLIEKIRIFHGEIEAPNEDEFN